MQSDTALETFILTQRHYGGKESGANAPQTGRVAKLWPIPRCNLEII
jgi:hypothetical protein